MSDEFTRLLGVRTGLSHGIIAVGDVKMSLLGPGGAYLPPARHCRKRQRVMNKVAELDKVQEILHRQLDDVKAALAAQS